MTLLYGKPVAENILDDAKRRIASSGIRPGLAAILVGDDPASRIYVRLKAKTAERIGMLFEEHDFSAGAAEEDILAALAGLNQRDDIHGIIVQLPLPDGFDADRIIAAIAPEKDADGFHQETLRRLFAGDRDAYPVLPAAVLALLRATGQPMTDKNAVVVANSELLGKVMTAVFSLEGIRAQLVLAECLEERKEQVKNADIVVSACGAPDLITGGMLRLDVIVIDAGITRVGDAVVGDADRESVGQVASFLTPVPGGVGPVTVATLLARVAAMASR